MLFRSDNALVALVDSRVSGMSRVVSVCAAATAAECLPVVDGGIGDAAAADAGVLPDASPVGPAPASCSCRAAPARSSGWVALVAALGLLANRRTRRRAAKPQGMSRTGSEPRTVNGTPPLVPPMVTTKT